MYDDALEVTTETQLRYHLERGEIVIYAPFADRTGCVFRKVSDDCYECLMQQQPGCVATTATDTLEGVVQAFNQLRDSGVDFWVLPGARLVYKPATVFDRVADFLRRKLGRKVLWMGWNEAGEE